MFQPAILVFRSEIDSFFGVAAQAQDSAGDGGFVAGKAAVFLQEILYFCLTRPHDSPMVVHQCLPFNPKTKKNAGFQLEA